MAFAYVSGLGESLGLNGGTSSPIDTTGATLIVVAVSRYNASTFSDSEGNSWTALATDPVTEGNVKTHLYYCINPDVGTAHTFTYGVVATAAPGIAVAAYSGTAPLFDADTENSGSAESMNTGALTPSFNDSLLVAVHGWENGNNVSIDLSFTEREDVPWVTSQNMGIALADKILATAASQNPTWTGTGSTSRISRMAVFYEDAGLAINMSGNGIASGEAFGSLYTGRYIDTPTGITSGEAFGSATVEVGQDIDLTGNGLASAEAFGSPTIPSLAEIIDLTGNAIASAEAIGSPRVIRLLIEATGIASAEAFGSATVEVGQDIDLTGNGIASAEAFGSLYVRTKYIICTGIASAESFSSPTILTYLTTPYYGSIGGANDFFNSRLDNYYWFAASGKDASWSEQAKALMHATMLINQFDYLDYKYTVRAAIDAQSDTYDWTTDAGQLLLRTADEAQTNEFPRGLSTDVPAEVDRACYLIAQALLSGRDPNVDFESLVVKESSYGGLKTNYVVDGNHNEHIAHLIPSAQAYRLLVPFFRDRDFFSVKKTS